MHKIFSNYLVASLRYGLITFTPNFPSQFGATAIFCRSKSHLIKKVHKIDPPKLTTHYSMKMFSDPRPPG